MTYRSYHDATTRSSVLAAVKDTGDAAAWARFFDLYAGFVFAIARSKGLKQLFVLTTKSAHFFLEKGFVPGTIEDLPAKKREHYNIVGQLFSYILV